MRVIFIAVLAAFIGGCVVATGMQVVSASGSHHPAAGGSSAGSVVFVARGDREVQLIDLPPVGSSGGDIRALNAPLYDRTRAHRIGRLDMTVVLTDPADRPGRHTIFALINAVATLPGGQIMFEGVGRYTKLANLPYPLTEAITGGTGVYAGARGTIESVPKGRAVVNTVHLLSVH